jgi:MinD-like ATPase involved in chromosome partitioning or flagellar assembly
MAIITFYSYKGGVGRSILLANTAYLLASNGYNVVCVDFDLEAGGLHSIFSINEVNVTSLQVILGNRLLTLVDVNNIKIPKGGTIKILPTVSTEGNLVNILVEAPPTNIMTRMKQVLDQISNDFNPDFILVDSRSGINEVMQALFDKSNIVVLVLKPNRQNLVGGNAILDYLSTQRTIRPILVISQVIRDGYSGVLEKFVHEIILEGKRNLSTHLIEFDPELLYEEYLPSVKYAGNNKKTSLLKNYEEVANTIFRTVMGNR